MTRARRWLLVVGVIAIAALLAFPLRETIYDTVIVPMAFIGWGFGLLYHSLSQSIWWWGIITIVLFMLVFSLLSEPKFRRSTDVKRKPPVGQVEDLAASFGKAERGIYFKWLVANRLGKLAYQILLHRESGRPRSVFAPLIGVDWQPTQELQNYLEIGLHGSFADFPNVKRAFGTPQKTPLDFEVAKAVEFLESQVENGHLP